MMVSKVDKYAQEFAKRGGEKKTKNRHVNEMLLENEIKKGGDPVSNKVSNPMTLSNYHAMLVLRPALVLIDTSIPKTMA